MYGGEGRNRLEDRCGRDGVVHLAVRVEPSKSPMSAGLGTTVRVKWGMALTVSRAQLLRSWRPARDDTQGSLALLRQKHPPSSEALWRADFGGQATLGFG